MSKHNFAHFEAFKFKVCNHPAHNTFGYNVDHVNDELG